MLRFCQAVLLHAKKNRRARPPDFAHMRPFNTPTDLPRPPRPGESAKLKQPEHFRFQQTPPGPFRPFAVATSPNGPIQTPPRGLPHLASGINPTASPLQSAAHRPFGPGKGLLRAPQAAHAPQECLRRRRAPPKREPQADTTPAKAKPTPCAAPRAPSARPSV